MSGSNSALSGGENALPNDRYTVCWIAALPHEAVAAKAALDQFHGRTPLAKNAADQNLYILGRIGDHNVVIASLPGGVMGPTPATTAAMHMLASFPSIRIGLMVGVGAGIPKLKKDRKTNKYRDVRDIRLGDVVVSQPSGTHGGVHQYDFGKAIVGGEFRPSGFLNSPPRALLNAVGVLRQLHEAGESNMPSHLSNILQSLNRARPSYAYPGQEYDRLFDAAYPHPPDEETCDDCIEDMEVARLERPFTDPVLHCGVIASGNQVIKDPAIRDRLGSDCICFEMESAGLMNDFPCLVIRGICDYADSHKNDGWQRYAAAVAAACAKEALQIMPKVEVEGERLAREVSQAAQMVISAVNDNVKPLQDDLTAKRTKEILDWLSQDHHTSIQADLLQKRCKGTGEWILSHPAFRSWIEGKSSTIFCSGIPGGGKTMTASVVIDHLTSLCVSNNSSVVYLYCRYDMRKEQTADRLLAALLRQLAEGRGHLHEAITRLDEECKKKRRPNTEQLRETLFSLVKSHANIFIVIDGLDECLDWDHDIRPRFLGTLRELQKIATVKLLATSRDIPIIWEEFDNDARLEISARKDDILKYLQGRQDLSRVMLSNKALQLQICQDISVAADGMYLLAQLYFDALKSKKTVADVKDALRGFIQGSRGLRALKGAYEAAIQRIDSREEEEDRESAHEVLRWVANAGRALSLNELNTALAIRPGDCRLNEENLTPDCCAEVISLCAGLVSINHGSRTVQLVHLTAKEYFDTDSPSWMACGPVRISLTCLTYLTFDDFACGRATSDQEFEARIDRHKLLQYASSYWGHHARQCQPALLQDRSAALWKFLQSRDLTATASQAGNAEGYFNGYSQEPAHWLWSHMLAHFGLEKIFTCVLSLHMGTYFQDVDVDFEDENCIMTPLALASSGGHDAVVKVLLDFGPGKVRLDSGVAFGYPTPLGHAVHNGHCGVVKLFMGIQSMTLDINSKTHCRRHQPLTVAAKKGFFGLVDLLIRFGQGRVDVDTTRDIHRRSPLTHAAQNGHYKIVKYLISLGPNRVNPDRRDKFGYTPLMLAAASGHADVVQLLMDLGPEKINANRTNRCGRTALQEAVIKDRLDTVITLLAYPSDRVDVNISTETFTQTALACAAEKGLVEIVGAFVSFGEGRVEFNARGWRGMTPLLWAAKEGHVDIVMLLTNLGSEFLDANLVDVDGCTALTRAVMNERYDTAKYLVELGEERVDTGIPDNRDFKASDYASRRRREFADLFS